MTASCGRSGRSQPATLSLLTDRRQHAPAGRSGGEAGAPGVNQVDGEELPAKVTLELDEGQVVTVKTPGGGGWGRVDDDGNGTRR